MRADRLLSIVMLLQARGCVTAQSLADAMEVSVRTIYRDMDALSAAGIPVYTERGPGGGCALLDEYRTSLTGLTREEVRALFMLSIPAPLVELGVAKELRAALRKLSAALPVARREEESRARQRIYLDSEGWFESQAPTPHLRIIQQAVWADRKLRVIYRLPFETRAEWTLAPYGLVAKANTWYLVGERLGRLRAYRVADVLDAGLSEEGFERMANFDLEAFWQAWASEIEGNRPSYAVSLLVAPDFLQWLPHIYGKGATEAISRAKAPDEKGWVPLTLSFETFEDARKQILGYGGAAKVLEPVPLRESIVDFAHQISALYVSAR